MAKLARLVFSSGGSNKFWQVETRGKEMRVTYGKLGSAGQIQVKTFKSAMEAEAEAQKLGSQKRKKGYVEEATSKRGPTPATKAASGPPASLVVRTSLGTVGAAWLIGSDVWFASVEGGEPLLASGPLAAAVAVDRMVERWRFATPLQARTAMAYVAKNAATKHALAIDTSADPAAWTKFLGKELPRIARFGTGGKGLVATRDVTHPWIHPRVPATSWRSGRLMVPVWSLVGALDPRFGKRTGVYVSTCPQQSLDPYIEGVSEVVVQTDAPSGVDAYFTGHRGQFATVHLSQQVDSIDDGVHWAVVEHSGDKSTVGWYRTHHVKALGDAKKLFQEKVAGHAGLTRVKAMGPWYAKILDDITRHHRVPAQNPGTAKLGELHAPMLHAVSETYGIPSSAVLRHSVVAIGGTPEFCQEPWNFMPKNPWGKSPLLSIASFGSGDAPLWSDVMNDGDAGTFNVWAAPGEPFGLVTFSCH